MTSPNHFRFPLRSLLPHMSIRDGCSLSLWVPVIVEFPFLVFLSWSDCFLDLFINVSWFSNSLCWNAFLKNIVNNFLRMYAHKAFSKHSCGYKHLTPDSLWPWPMLIRNVHLSTGCNRSSLHVKQTRDTTYWETILHGISTYCVTAFVLEHLLIYRTLERGIGRQTLGPPWTLI